MRTDEIEPVPGSTYFPSHLSLPLGLPKRRAIEIIKDRHLDPETEADLLKRLERYYP